MVYRNGDRRFGRSRRRLEDDINECHHEIRGESANCLAVGGDLSGELFTTVIIPKVNQSHYRLEVPRGFQEVKIPRLRDSGPQDGGKVVSLTHRPFLPPGNTPGSHFW